MQNHAKINSLSCLCIYRSFYSSNCYGNPPLMVPCLHSSNTSCNGLIIPNTLLWVNNPLPLTSSLLFNSHFPITVNSPNSVNTIVSDNGPINTMLPVNSRFLSSTIWSSGKGFSVLHLNIHFLYLKLDEIKLFNFEKQLDVLCLCETFLNVSFSDHELSINNYNIFRRDRGTGCFIICVTISSFYIFQYMGRPFKRKSLSNRR